MSTTCGTGASRICTNGASSAKCSAKCRPTRPCAPDEKCCIPGGSRVCPRRAWCSSRTSPSPALVTVLWPRKASFAVGPYEWCSTVARAIAIDIRSCRHHERSRRSRRRLAAPVQATSAMLPARVLENTRDKCALQSTLVFNCFGPRRLVVCVVCGVCVCVLCVCCVCGVCVCVCVCVWCECDVSVMCVVCVCDVCGFDAVIHNVFVHSVTRASQCLATSH